MVSQCVLRLNYKTPAGLTRYGYCVQHTWLWRSSALVLDDRHWAPIADGGSTNPQVVCGCHTSHQRKAQATSLSCELSQNIASPLSFFPTRTSAACPPLAPLCFRELYTGVFVVYSAIIFCSFLALYCMLPLLYFIAHVVFITQFFGDMRLTRVSVRCGIFYAKILPKIVDTSGFLPYHKGSFWIKKLCRGQK